MQRQLLCDEEPFATSRQHLTHQFISADATHGRKACERGDQKTAVLFLLFCAFSSSCRDYDVMQDVPKASGVTMKLFMVRRRSLITPCLCFVAHNIMCLREQS